MGKRWIAALAASVLLLGFAACGGDDDDDDAVGTDDTEESDEGGVSQAALCDELEADTGEDASIDEVEDIIGVMEAAAEDAPGELADALETIIGIYEDVIDADDGDGVITDEEGGAVVEANADAPEAFNVVFDYCQDTGGEGEADDDAAVEPEQAEVDEAKAAFCADLDRDTGDGIAVEDVQAEIDRAVGAQTAAETQEQLDSLQLLVDFGTATIDGDDGDGVITVEELSATAEAFPTVEDAIAELTSWCG